MDLDPGSWGGLELGLKIGPVKTSNSQITSSTATYHTYLSISIQRPQQYFTIGTLCSVSVVSLIKEHSQLFVLATPHAKAKERPVPAENGA